MTCFLCLVWCMQFVRSVVSVNDEKLNAANAQVAVASFVVPTTPPPLNASATASTAALQQLMQCSLCLCALHPSATADAPAASVAEQNGHSYHTQCANFLNHCHDA